MRLIVLLLFALLPATVLGDFTAAVQKVHLSPGPVGDHALDQLFGIEYEKIEKDVPQDKYYSHANVGLKKGETQTEYDIIREVFRAVPLKEGEVFMDLGSGYGRLLFYGGALYPKTQFVGIELVKERTDHVQALIKKHKLRNVEVINADVLNADLSNGTHFYMFNPFPPLMKKVLERLHQISKTKKITIISTASSTLDLLEVPWLKQLKLSKENKYLGVFESR